eukprot:GDKJ01059006.1.p3 GENE.GDKJ01059006.1~~GDKJ01059006.1.p3  ORF type:complete len:115 (+),score=0.25 GDKJ01059006.1:162-506(+)
MLIDESFREVTCDSTPPYPATQREEITTSATAATLPPLITSHATGVVEPLEHPGWAITWAMLIAMEPRSEHTIKSLPNEQYSAMEFTSMISRYASAMAGPSEWRTVGSVTMTPL